MAWDFRTFSGLNRIRNMLQDRLADAQLRDMVLVNEESTLGLQRPFTDLAWIQFSFKFQARGFATGSSIVRLVPVGGFGEDAGGNPKPVTWKAHVVFTHLDGLKDYPELSGDLRQQQQQQHSQPGTQWLLQRQSELNPPEDEDPTVLVVGGAQAGMTIAARLKYLGIKVLVVEREDRIGGNWRSRYDALSLHDPVCKSYAFIH